MNVVDTMQAGNVLGWNRSFATLPSLPFSSNSPDFIGTGTGSNGLLIRQRGGDGKVYLVQNGWRRHIADPVALAWNGVNWDANVIDVAPAFLASPFSFGEGSKVYGVGELSNQLVSQSFKQVYDATLSASTCGSTSFASGWPGAQFSSCLGLPQTTADQQALSSAVSGISGTFQSFGDQTTTFGAINSSARGTYAVWGNIFQAWKPLYSAGKCGFPTSSVHQGAAGLQQDFEGGYIPSELKQGSAIWNIRHRSFKGPGVSMADGTQKTYDKLRYPCRVDSAGWGLSGEEIDLLLLQQANREPTRNISIAVTSRTAFRRR